jgi:hypothetical protein
MGIKVGFSECIVGIYKIECKYTSKIYIGQSIDCKNRLLAHKSYLKNDGHGNSFLQKHYNQYGPDCFNFEIIEECVKEDLNLREMFYILKYNCNMRNNNGWGFNQNCGGGYYFLEPKVVFLFNLYGQCIDVCNSAKELGIKYKINTGAIYCAISNNSLCDYKYFFSYENTIPEEVYSKYIKPIYAFNKKGKFLGKFDFIKDVMEHFKLTPEQIGSSLYHKYIVNKKYFFSFKNEFTYKPIKEKNQEVFVFNEKGKFLKRFDSFSECDRFYNFKRGVTNISCKRGCLYLDKYYFTRTKKFTYKKTDKKYRKNETPIGLFDLNGKLFKKFISIVALSDFLNVERRIVVNALISIHTTFENKYYIKYIDPKSPKKIKLPEKKFNNNFYIYDVNKNYITYIENLEPTAKYFNITVGVFKRWLDDIKIRNNPIDGNYIVSQEKLH